MSRAPSGRDLTDPRWMIVKALGFVVIALVCLVLIFLETASLQVVGLTVMACWALARAYYFCFYVIEKYIDPEFRFAGIASAVRFLLSRRK